MKLLGAGLVFFVAQYCSACIYFPDGFDPSQFREVEREALMFRSKGDPSTVNLVIKSSLKGKLPAEMAWVLPLPSMPEVKEADSSIFSEMNGYFAPQIHGEPWWSGIFDIFGGQVLKAASLPSSAIKVHSAKVVGNHEIVPIEIRDDSGAGEEMNEWLRGNGYIELPAEIQRPYLKKGAVFLAVKVRPEGDDVELRPLWISYKAEWVEFPVRFTHDYRTFDLNLYFIRSVEDAGAMWNIAEKLSGFLPAKLSSKLLAATREGLPPSAEIRRVDIATVLSPYGGFGKYASIAEGTVLEKVFIPGVNVNFRTKDLEADPGI